MIKIKNLSKTYNKNKKNECKALKNVSFNLGNKGMIFIVGKSGSGKSTLLNILGGLDSCTSGSVYFNKQKISNFTPKELEVYRSNNVGFIFQDYCLIESMSVYENIELALSVQGVKDHDAIVQTIKDVGLQNKIDTPVNLLSGGQKQRVAIARAIVKKPSIILADEPTGNLDSKTTKQIFSILKKISNEQLVVVISHNINDANKYADRIIEINEGQIVSDIDNIFNSSENVAVLSHDATISDENLQIVNDQIKKHNIEIVKTNANYKPHIDSYEDEKNFEYKKLKNKMFFKDKLKLFKHFFKRKVLGVAIIVILLSSLITLAGLCQTFNNINDNQLLLEAIEQDATPLIFKKGVYDDYAKKINDSYLGHVTDKDILEFKNYGYDGELFKLYRYAIPITKNYDSTCFGKPSKYGITGGFYLTNNGLGVLGCSQEYLTNLYGENGELNVLSGSLSADDGGIIITDYFADSILNVNKNLISSTSDKYELLTSAKDLITRRYKISAVIDTNYLERYAWIIEKFKQAQTYPLQVNKYLDEIKNNELTYQFIEEVNNFLAIAYTFNEDFIEQTLSDPRKYCNIHYFENIEITSTNNDVLLNNNTLYQCVDGIDLTKNKTFNLANDEIYVTAHLYNSLFNTGVSQSDTSAFQEKEIYLNLYTSARKYGDSPKHTKKLTIKGIFSYDNECAMVASDDLFKELRRIDLSAYALYGYGGNNNAILYQTAESLYYEGSSEYIITVQRIIKTINVFKDVFFIILLGLFIISIFILSSYILRNILNKKRELGIMRAIGTKNLDTSAPFNIASIIIGICSAVLSTIGFYSICNVTNTLITKGFATNFNLPMLETMNFICFKPIIILMDLLLLFAIIALCSITPILAMRRIKPIDIMRKE